MYTRITALLLVGFLVLTSFSPLNKQDNTVLKVIVLDAGHGGKDPGCLGKLSTIEKTIALDVTLKVGELIKKKYARC